MNDTDTPNRQSNMEKAEGDRDEACDERAEEPPRAPDPPERDRTKDEPTLRTEM
jgi:hypothetical protein